MMINFRICVSFTPICTPHQFITQSIDKKMIISFYNSNSICSLSYSQMLGNIHHHRTTVETKQEIMASTIYL